MNKVMQFLLWYIAFYMFLGMTDGHIAMYDSLVTIIHGST